MTKISLPFYHLTKLVSQKSSCSRLHGIIRELMHLQCFPFRRVAFGFAYKNKYSDHTAISSLSVQAQLTLLLLRPIYAADFQGQSTVMFFKFKFAHYFSVLDYFLSDIYTLIGGKPVFCHCVLFLLRIQLLSPGLLSCLLRNLKKKSTDLNRIGLRHYT